MENFDGRSVRETKAALEGILFASGDPVPLERLAVSLSVEPEQAEELLRLLAEEYEDERRGFRLLRMEDSYQLCSAPEYAEIIRSALEVRRPTRLAQTSLEVLAIVAYYQPVTRAYIDKVRGVDSSYTVNVLLRRGLIEDCGCLQAVGKPRLYRTTEEFLRAFHLHSLRDLPPLDEGLQPDGSGQIDLMQDSDTARDSDTKA